MIARDLGCSFPGCTAPPAWCQAHHITDFSLTRRTSVDDATLLCGLHREHPRLGGFKGTISLTVFPAVSISRFRRPGIGRRR